MRTAEECRHLSTLADTLWVERHLVEHLRYKLVSARLLLAADERRFVPRAVTEVDQVMARLWAAEAERDRAVTRVARDWRVPEAELTLLRLTLESPPPWDTVFDDHRETFQRLADEIEATARENRRLASGALQAVRTSLSTLTGADTAPADDGYRPGSGGTAVAVKPPATRVDFAL